MLSKNTNFDDKSLILDVNPKEIQITEDLLNEVKSEEFSETLMNYFLLELTNNQYYGEELLNRFTIFNSNMWSKILHTDIEISNEEICRIKHKHIFKKDFIIGFEKNTDKNYWSMYIIQNLSSLFNEKFTTQSNTNRFHVYFLSSSNGTIKVNNKNLNETIKKIIHKLFTILTNNEFKLSQCLVDQELFEKADFDSTIIELEVKIGENPGVMIAGALQELFSYVFVEDDNVNNIKFNKVTEEEYSHNLRSILYTKIFDVYSQIQKEKKRLQMFSLQKERKNKTGFLKDISGKKGLNPFGKGLVIGTENKKEISMKIFSKDSRKVMNEVLNDMCRSSETSLLNENKLNQKNQIEEVCNYETNTENLNRYRKSITKNSFVSNERKSREVISSSQKNNNYYQFNVVKSSNSNLHRYTENTSAYQSDLIENVALTKHFSPSQSEHSDMPYSSFNEKITRRFSKLSVQLAFQEEIIKNAEEKPEPAPKNNSCCSKSICIIY